MYLEVVVPASGQGQIKKAVQQLSDDYADRDAVQARIYERKSDIATEDNPGGNTTGVMRAANSGCGEAQTGVKEGRYEFEPTG